MKWLKRLKSDLVFELIGQTMTIAHMRSRLRRRYQNELGWNWNQLCKNNVQPPVQPLDANNRFWWIAVSFTFTRRRSTIYWKKSSSAFSAWGDFFFNFKGKTYLTALEELSCKHLMVITLWFSIVSILCYVFFLVSYLFREFFLVCMNWCVSAWSGSFKILLVLHIIEYGFKYSNTYQ